MVAIASPRSDGYGSISLPALRPVGPARLRPSARVRRRRRQVAAVVLGLAGVAALQVGDPAGVVSAGARRGAGAPPAPTALNATAVQDSHIVYIVKPGDTAWAIARAWRPHGEIRPLVDRLVAQEHGRPLQPGDRLVLR